MSIHTHSARRADTDADAEPARGTGHEATSDQHRQRLLLLMLATAQLMLVLDVTVVNVALPEIGDALRLGPAAVPWVLTAYTITFGGLMLLGGRLADALGSRRVLLGGLGLFTGSSLLCAIAPGPELLLAGRAAQGVGAAALSPAALALLTTTFSGASRHRALGVWGALSGAGSALGVVLGGVLTSGIGWRWIFAINIPIGVAILLTLPRLVPTTRVADDRPSTTRLGGPAALLVTGGTGSAIYGLVNAGSHGWTTPSTVVPLVAAALLWALVVLVEQRSTEPLLAVGLLRRRAVAAGAFLMLVATGLMVGGFFLGSFALQRIHGYSAVQVGVAFLPVAVAVIAGAHVAGQLLMSVAARSVAAGGLALATVGETWLAVSSEPVAIVGGLTVAAAGIGAVFVTAFTATLSEVEGSEAGLRSAVINTFHELGGAFGVAVLAGLAGAGISAGAVDADGFPRAFAAAAITAAVSLVVALALVPAITRPAHQVGHHHGH